MISLYIVLLYFAVAFVSVICFGILTNKDKWVMLFLGLSWPISVPIFTTIIVGKIVRDSIKC